MDSGKFIRCRNCDAIHRVTPFDRAPVYAARAGGVDEIAADDWREFVQRHANHRLEPLRATGREYFASGSAADPMGTGYIEVTDGQKRFLLRRSRSSIEEPLKYELVEQRIVDRGFTLEVQEQEIKKEMKHHFTWTPATPLDDDRIDFFIGLFKETVKGIEPNAVQLSGHSATDNAIVYGVLEPAVIDALMLKCAGYFPPDELQAIRRFVESHREICDVMALRVCRHFAIEPACG